MDILAAGNPELANKGREVKEACAKESKLHEHIFYDNDDIPLLTVTVGDDECKAAVDLMSCARDHFKESLKRRSWRSSSLCLLTGDLSSIGVFSREKRFKDVGAHVLYC